MTLSVTVTDIETGDTDTVVIPDHGGRHVLTIEPRKAGGDGSRVNVDEGEGEASTDADRSDAVTPTTSVPLVDLPWYQDRKVGS